MELLALVFVIAVGVYLGMALKELEDKLKKQAKQERKTKEESRQNLEILEMDKEEDDFVAYVRNVNGEKECYRSKSGSGWYKVDEKNELAQRAENKVHNLLISRFHYKFRFKKD